jgi:hypothetical protein
MKKVLLLILVASVSAKAADWSSLFGETQQNQQPQSQQFNWRDLLGGSRQQQAEPVAVNNEAQRPGFFDSVKNMMGVMNDPDVKAKSEELKALIDRKLREAAGQPAANQAQPQQQSGFNWGSLGSLFGGSAGNNAQAPVQNRTQQEGWGQQLMRLLGSAQQ